MPHASNSDLARKKRALYILISIVTFFVGAWLLIHAPRNGKLDVTNALEWGGGVLLVGLGFYRAYKAFTV